MDKSLYYNPDKLLSHNRILNFTIGARGIGKSYAMKKRLTKRFIENGEMFILIRRYKTELQKAKTFFNDIKQEFPDNKFEVKGREFFIDGKLAGYAIALSTFQNEKSASYPDVVNVMFDEFIREGSSVGYLPNEVNSFLNLLDTIIRTRDNVRVVCMSNAVTIINPYFLYFGVIPDVSKRFNKYDDIIIEIPESQDFAEERKKTRFGRLIAPTEYAEMSLNNKFTQDVETFIQKRPKSARFKFSVTFKGATYGIWYNPDDELLHFSHAHDPSTKDRYILTREDMTENERLTLNWKKEYQLKKMVSAFTRGLLRFDDQLARTKGYEMFSDMNIF